MWRKVLKQKDAYDDDYVEREGKKLGPGKMTGAFTMSMFANHNWVKQLEQLLTVTALHPETGKQEEMVQQITKDAINSSVQYAVDLMDSMLKNTSFGDILLESTEKYSESTKTFTTEHEKPEPTPAEAGKGMMPKRVEHIANSVSGAFDKTIERLMVGIHELIDRKHARGAEAEIPNITKIKSGESLPDELKDDIFKTMEPMLPEIIKEGCKEISEVLENLDPKTGKITNQEINMVQKEILDKENTKDFMTNIYFILVAKISQGMGRRSSELLEVELGDILTPAELEWFKANTKSAEMDLGAMGSVRMESKPEVDPKTGIPKTEQFDPETGKPYFIPSDIGEIDKPDFDPAEEEFEEHDKGKAFRRPSTSTAPRVKDYVSGKQRREGEPSMQVPPEWEQWQEKNAMEKLQIDSFVRAWGTIKKK
jgi:hypothetical protein